MKERSPIKYQVLRDELLRTLRTGELVSGQKLPPERELAARFDAHRVSSILADDKLAVEMAVAHLREMGHKTLLW